MATEADLDFDPRNQTQRLSWLTTEDVQARFGFDPRPFLADREPRIHAKLLPVVLSPDGVFTARVWLQDDVASHPRAQPAQG